MCFSKILDKDIKETEYIEAEETQQLNNLIALLASMPTVSDEFSEEEEDFSAPAQMPDLAIFPSYSEEVMYHAPGPMPSLETVPYFENFHGNIDDLVPIPVIIPNTSKIVLPIISPAASHEPPFVVLPDHLLPPRQPFNALPPLGDEDLVFVLDNMGVQVDQYGRRIYHPDYYLGDMDECICLPYLTFDM